MKVKTNNNGMKQLKDLGFKKVPSTSPGFHMYELTPAKLKPQAASDKPQAASSKHLTNQSSRII